MRSLATTVVTVALAGALLSACGDDGSPAAEPSTASATPAMSQSVTPGDPPSPSESGGSDDHDPDARSLPYRGGNVAGNWETGDLLGERLPAGRRFGRRQVMYAVTGSSKDGHALISLGLVEGGRIFRILPALVPEAEEAPDGSTSTAATGSRTAPTS